MATSTTRLGLRKPVGADTVQVALDISGSMDTLDTAVDRICTSSTRPSTVYVGMRAYETDTNRLIVCTQATPSIKWTYTNSMSATASTRPVETGTSDLAAGARLYETDTHNSLVFAGSAWEHQSMPVVAATSDVANPFEGMLVYNKTDHKVYKYRASSTSWVTKDAFVRYYKSANQGVSGGDNVISFPNVDTASGADPRIVVSSNSFVVEPGRYTFEASLRLDTAIDCNIYFVTGSSATESTAFGWSSICKSHVAVAGIGKKEFTSSTTVSVVLWASASANVIPYGTNGTHLTIERAA